MNIAGFEKIAKYLANPLVLIGFVLWLVLTLYSEIVKSGLLPQVTPETGGEILKLIVQYGALGGLVLMVLGFGLAFFKASRNK